MCQHFTLHRLLTCLPFPSFVCLVSSVGRARDAAVVVVVVVSAASTCLAGVVFMIDTTNTGVLLLSLFGVHRVGQDWMTA